LSVILPEALNRQRPRPERGAKSPRESERGWDPASIRTLSIKAKQVAGVTALVVLVVAGMIAVQIASLTQLRIDETASRAKTLKESMLHRATVVVREAGVTDPYEAIRNDGGMRSILLSSVTNQPDTNTILYAAIVNTEGLAIAHSNPAEEGQPTAPLEDLSEIVSASAFDQLRFVLEERRYELREQVLAGEKPFGAIHIGVSTLFVGAEIRKALEGFGYTALVALAVSTMVATLLAQWMLRPIHVIQSGLTRLGRGELDVRLDLPGQEFADLGNSFEAVSAQLAAVRNNALPATSSSTEFESVMENLEDAVALFSPEGELMFSNAAMRALLPGLVTRPGSPASGKPALSLLAENDPVRQLVGGGGPRGPRTPPALPRD
jgi:HAMP domain